MRLFLKDCQLPCGTTPNKHRNATLYKDNYGRFLGVVDYMGNISTSINKIHTWSTLVGRLYLASFTSVGGGSQGTSKLSVSGAPDLAALTILSTVYRHGALNAVPKDLTHSHINDVMHMHRFKRLLSLQDKFKIAE